MDEHIIEINGVITSYYNSRDFVKYFMNKAEGKPIRAKINCYGGDVNQAIAIANLFSEHGNVTVEFIGFNASSATWMAFGAKNIEIHEDAMWLAHRCSMYVDAWGMLNKDQIEDKIKEMESAKKSAEAIDLMIASKYSDRTNKDLKNIFDLMNENRWMSATEAKEWGFVDTVIPSKGKKASVTNQIAENLAAMGLPVPELQNNEADKGFLSKLFGSLENKMDKVLEKINHPEPKPADISNQNNIKPTMRKEFILLNQILNVEGFAENEGKVTLTVENLKAINDAIDAAKEGKRLAEEKVTAANTDKDTAVSNYNGAIEAINGLSDEVKGKDKIEDKIGVIKNILDKVPGVKPAAPVNTGDGPDFSDIAQDPINKFDEL